MVIQRLVDFMFALPGLLIAIVIVGVVGGGYGLAVVVLSILNVAGRRPPPARRGARAALAALRGGGPHARRAALADHVPPHLAQHLADRVRERRARLRARPRRALEPLPTSASARSPACRSGAAMLSENQSLLFRTRPGCWPRRWRSSSSRPRSRSSVTGSTTASPTVAAPGAEAAAADAAARGARPPHRGRRRQRPQDARRGRRSVGSTQGETIAIVGESGSGKSLQRPRRSSGCSRPGVVPSAGQIVFDGRDMLQEGPARGRAAARRQHLDDLPGPVHDAEPAPALLEAHRGGAPDPRGHTDPRQGGRAREAIARLAEVGITDPDRGRPLPVPALGRDAPARGARRGARRRPARPDRRRAVDRARRDDAGRDPRPAARTCSARAGWA